MPRLMGIIRSESYIGELLQLFSQKVVTDTRLNLFIKESNLLVFGQLPYFRLYTQVYSKDKIVDILVDIPSPFRISECPLS